MPNDNIFEISIHQLPEWIFQAMRNIRIPFENMICKVFDKSKYELQEKDRKCDCGIMKDLRKRGIVYKGIGTCINIHYEERCVPTPIYNCSWCGGKL